MSKTKQKHISDKEFEENMTVGLAIKSSNDEMIILTDVSPFNKEIKDIRMVKVYNVTHNKKHEGYLFHDNERKHVVMYIRNYPSTYIAEVVEKSK
jgi:hypothetical protein